MILKSGFSTKKKNNAFKQRSNTCFLRVSGKDRKLKKKKSEINILKYKNKTTERIKANKNNNIEKKNVFFKKPKPPINNKTKLKLKTKTKEKIMQFKVRKQKKKKQKKVRDKTQRIIQFCLCFYYYFKKFV